MMKTFSKLMLLPVLLLGATACSNDVFDDPDNNENQGVNSELYFTFQVTQVTDGTRSATNGDDSSDGGTEIASDSESKISNVVFVMLADDNKTVVAKSNYDSTTAAGECTVGFESSALLRYVGTSDSSKDAYFYVFCNIDPNDINAVADEEFDKNQLLNVTAASNGWTDNNFWMTNADATSLKLSVPKRSILQEHNTASNPYPMNSVGSEIKVDRVCARFDYQSASQGAGATENEYFIYNYTYTPGGGFTKNTSSKLASIVLTDMTLINESKTSYALKRVSADGSSTGWTILGAETPSNYVVDWDAAAKYAWANSPTSNYANSGSYNNYFDTSSTFDVSSLGDWTPLANWKTSGGLGEDNNDGTWASTATNYRKFKYLMPNTLQLNTQMKGLTTGVVFRGKIVADASNTTLVNDMTAGATVLAYDKVILCQRSNMATYTSTMEATNPIRIAYAAAEAEIVSLGAEGNEERVREIYVKHGFKCLMPDASGEYAVYYYYWNRHNDNGQPDIMGPMEFGVVRNNVYKLSVTDIEAIGHTAQTKYDPDPETPNDPDENGKIYLKVAVKVLPWVVRINNITF